MSLWVMRDGGEVRWQSGVRVGKEARLRREWGEMQIVGGGVDVAREIR